MEKPKTTSPQTIEVPCNLCGSSKWKVLYQNFLKNSDKNIFDANMTTDVYSAYGQVVKCRECGLVYRNPRESNDAVLSAYAEMEDHDYMQELECRGMNALLCLRVIKKHKKRGKLLDVGCSTGFLLNAARMDFETTGIEPSKWAAQYAKNTLKLEVTQGMIEEAPYEKNSFDVITLVDVIEHLTDPQSMIQKATTLLKPGGLLYLVTPDINSLSSKILRGRWWALRPAHLYYFSKKTLEKMLTKSGFSIMETRPYGRMFSYGYWLSRLQKYPKFIYHMIKLIVKIIGSEDKVVYINTRDSIEVCAIKK